MGASVRRMMMCGAVLALAAAMAVGQAQAPSAPPSQTATPVADGKQKTPTAAGISVVKPEYRMSKQDAKDLMRSADEILNFASIDTDLPIVRHIKKKIVTREEAKRYFDGKMKEDRGVQEIERSEVVLKKFGMLDHDFHLGPFLLSLLTEQVAGYYEPTDKTINMLDWVEPDSQRPVLAHELTHALQDQHVGLKQWSSMTHYDVAKNAAEDNEHIQTDEADTAREAVLEGQAMAVFTDYGLSGQKLSLRTTPEAAQKVEDAMGDVSDSPVMSRAPLLLQQELLFPYREGLGFEAALLKAGGVDTAFTGALDRPPASSYEILNPEAYLRHEGVPVLRLPDIHPLLDANGYVPYDVGVMGELDVRILTEVFAGRETADAIAPEWRGGVYYAAEQKTAVTPEQKSDTRSLGLVYYSQWANEDTAKNFAHVYAGQLGRKYVGLKERTAEEQNEEEKVYSTAEGDVLVQTAGTGVFVSEGFDMAMARQVEQEIVAAQATGPVQQAGSVPRGELGFSMVHALIQSGAAESALHSVTQR